MSNEIITKLNQVEGFNPESYARDITDGDGQNARKYLDVVWRKMWFRLKHPNGKITKRIIRFDEKAAVIEAKVYFEKNDAEENYISSALAYREPDPQNMRFGSRYLESAETAAVGRALADAGFGLQFCCDKSEAAEQDIVDAPIEPSKKQPVDTPAPKSETTGKTGNNASADKPKEQAPVKNQDNTQKPSNTNAPAGSSGNLTAPIRVLPNLANKPANTAETKTDNAVKPDNTKSKDIPAVSEPAESGKTQEKKYNKSMEVSEIMKIMTLDEAACYVIDTGNNIGKEMSEIMGNTAEESIKKLEWYYVRYSGPNNCLRAAAKIMAEYYEKFNKPAGTEKEILADAA